MLLALVLFTVNILPILQVSFYQDDYNLLDCLQAWDKDFTKAIAQDGFHQGFRPLHFAQKLVLWNLFKDNSMLYHAFLIGIHFLFGLILFKGTLIFCNSKLHASIVVLLYFSSTVTNQTVYSWGGFFFVDIISIFIIYLLIKWKDSGINNYLYYIFILSGIAVFTKESGISIVIIVILFSLYFIKHIGKINAFKVISLELILILFYAIMHLNYAHAIGGKKDFVDFLFFSKSQIIGVIKGIIISSFSPFTSIYLSLRKTGFATSYSIITTAILTLSFFWILLASYSYDKKKIIENLKKRVPLGAGVLILIIILLLPHLPGKWFELRMLVVTFALGMFLWGILLADAVSNITNIQHKLQKTIVIFICLIAAFGAGTPLSRNTEGQEEAARILTQIVKEAELRNITTLFLSDFPTQGSYFRIINARGLVRYVSNRKIKVTAITNPDNIPITEENYAIITYNDFGSYKNVFPNDIPISVKWMNDP